MPPSTRATIVISTASTSHRFVLFISLRHTPAAKPSFDFCFWSLCHRPSSLYRQVCAWSFHRASTRPRAGASIFRGNNRYTARRDKSQIYSVLPPLALTALDLDIENDCSPTCSILSRCCMPSALACSPRCRSYFGHCSFPGENCRAPAKPQ